MWSVPLSILLNIALGITAGLIAMENLRFYKLKTVLHLPEIALTQLVKNSYGVPHMYTVSFGVEHSL